MLAVQEENGALFRYRFGQVEFDESRFELRVGGETVETQPKPLELLALLLRTPGEVVTTEEILQSVWKYQNPAALETNVIGTALTKLRSALGKDARRIVNLPRVGYRFEGRVERVVVGRTLSSGLSLEPGTPVPLRPNFVLGELLSRSRYSEVWRARHAKTGEPRIYKFSPAGDRLPALKREATLYRLLRDALGERTDFARVIDWNFAEAPFFLECEDGGQNLRKWAEQDGRLPGMSMQQRIDLFLHIADAVAAAHSVGVLHKDLKPDNVLIAPAGDGWQVKLTDFGSGQLLEPARLEDLGITLLGFTATQNVAGDATTGTLLYMAPELTRGETPTVQSDVYALGLLLYQLVIADMRRPLVSGWQREVSDELLQQDIAAATDGNPAHRLGSVAELARRLRTIRQRRDELSLRRRLEQIAAETQEELKRTRARRPWLIASLASMAIGLVVCGGLYYRSNQAFHRAEEQRNRAEAINRFLNEDLLGAADTSGPGGQRDPTVKVLLSRAAGRLEGRFGDDPVTKASIELAIGNAYRGLGDQAESDAFETRAVARLRQSRGARDLDTIEAEYTLARTLGMKGQYDKVEELLAQADTGAGTRLDQPSQLSLLAAWSHGNLFLMRMQPDRALPYYQKADAIRTKALPDDETWLFRSRGALAWCYVRLGRNEEALAVLQDLMQPQYSLERINTVDWQKVHLQFALALANLSRFDEAEANLKDTLGQMNQVLGEDNYLTGLTWNHLGSVYQSAGKWHEAIAAQGRAYEIVRRTGGEQSQIALGVHSELAIAMYMGGRVSEALPLLQSSHDALAAKLGEEASLTQDDSFYLASALVDLGRVDEAATLLPHLNAVAVNSVDPGPDWAQRISALRGSILIHQGQTDQGRSLLAGALEQLSRENAPEWMLTPIRDKMNAAAETKLISRR